jgi:hypothetical protein
MVPVALIITFAALDVVIIAEGICAFRFHHRH